MPWEHCIKSSVPGTSVTAVYACKTGLCLQIVCVDSPDSQKVISFKWNCGIYKK